MSTIDSHKGNTGSGFSPDDLVRYSRQLILPEVGIDGQRRLASASVLIIGAGGLGSPLGLYLAASGIGRIGIVDFDKVDVSNLHRQVMYDSSDIGKPKAEAARARLLSLNPGISVEVHNTRLTSDDALSILGRYDVIIDGTDNFPTRYLVNDACVLLHKPLVYGSIFRFEGQVSLFDSMQGPCYRCLYPSPPPPELVPNCAEGGVLGVLPGIIGSLQAIEAMKFILSVGDLLVGRLLLFDALAMSFRELKLKKNPECPICGTHPSIHTLIDYDAFCSGATSVRETVPVVSVEELKSKIDAGESLLLLDVREPFERELSSIGGVLIPLGELERRSAELDRSSQIIVYCRSGARSAKAAGILKAAGFSNVRNLAGGLQAWARKFDPAMRLH